MKHYIVYATGPKGFVKKDPELGLLLEETMMNRQINRQVLESGEMTPREAANKCMMAYVQAVRLPEVGDDPVEVHTYLDKNGYAIAFTASWSDGREIIVCRGREQNEVGPEERLPVFDEADDDEWLHPEKEPEQ